MPAHVTPYNPPNTEIEVIYIDSDVIAVNKPAGLLSVPGRGADKQDCLITRLQQQYPEALTVHRLDMPTSGIILFARSANCHKQLSIQFQERKVSKTYTAIVEGIVQSQQGEVNAPLITDWPNRPKQKIDFENGKPSLTRYKVISQNTVDNSTRLSLTPVTGRSHQLRVHMLSIGHIIVGDMLYTSENHPTANTRLMLHANKISFEQPGSKKCINLECPPEF